MKWRIAGALVLAAAVLAGVVFDVAEAPDAEMEPSILEGDVLVLGPVGEPAQGDVLLIEDPTEPGRLVLRRVIGTAGDEGRYEVRRREMLRGSDRVITNEADRWLVRERTSPRLEPSVRIDTPEDHVYVLADHRDLGLDSRWWGPIPMASVRSRVVLRVGSSDEWRSPISLGAEDGPWIPPSRLGED